MSRGSGEVWMWAAGSSRWPSSRAAQVVMGTHGSYAPTHALPATVVLGSARLGLERRGHHLDGHELGILVDGDFFR